MSDPRDARPGAVTHRAESKSARQWGQPRGVLPDSGTPDGEHDGARFDRSSQRRRKWHWAAAAVTHVRSVLIGGVLFGREAVLVRDRPFGGGRSMAYGTVLLIVLRDR